MPDKISTALSLITMDLDVNTLFMVTMNVEIIPPVSVPLYLAYLPGARLDAIIGPTGRQAELSLSQVEKALTILMPPASARLG